MQARPTPRPGDAVRLLSLLLIVSACADPTGERQPTGPGDPGDSPTDPVEWAQVGHRRELRGVWLTTVWNIDLPTRPGAPAAAQERELIEALDVLADSGFNAVFYQARPEGDAAYASQIEPWSRFLSGSPGVDPGYDPLEVLVREGHARNLEVHAWLNPYRAGVSATATPVAPHLAVTHPSAVVRYGNNLWMDPSNPVVQDRLIAVIEDLVTRYEIDGVHFDDYFYPYPISGTPFPDDASFEAYQRGGGELGRSDWRREQVNTMVARVHDTLRRLDPTVRFGISPFGIYRPGQPEGIAGLDSYEALYADPVHWSEQGWVDYLAPQLYWPSTQTAQAFGPLIDWWSALGDGRHHTFAGHYLSKLGEGDAWTLDELATQVQLGRAHHDRGAQGGIWFSYAPLRDDRHGVRAVLRDRIYPEPALTPAFGDDDRALDPPDLTVGPTIALDHPGRLRAFGVYRDDASTWTLDRVVPAAERSVDLPPGRWAISAVHRDGRESLAVVVERED